MFWTGGGIGRKGAVVAPEGKVEKYHWENSNFGHTQVANPTLRPVSGLDLIRKDSY